MIEDRSTFHRRDLIAESPAGITARPSRTALTALGTVLGVASLVATLGLAHTVGNRIVSRAVAAALQCPGSIGASQRCGGGGATAFSIPAVAASSVLFGAVRAEVATGKVFDESHNALGASVAVIGLAAAQRLSITQVDNQPAIFIGDEGVVVIGILNDVQREPVLQPWLPVVATILGLGIGVTSGAYPAWRAGV